MNLNGSISRERICELLNYDPATGSFTRVRSGRDAGSCDGHGAIQILVDGRRYRAHRLAWLIMTGEWPVLDIDHKDGNPANNKWGNIRLATESQNAVNAKMQKNNTSGFKGVYLIKSTGRWRACVRSGRRQKHLGMFDTREEAASVAQAAAISIYGEYYRAA